MLKRNDLFPQCRPCRSNWARGPISEAARQLDPDQRLVLFTEEARGQLHGDDYINKNKEKVGAALASVELARLTSYHAQALLSKAMREPDNESRQQRAKPAEEMFIQAGKELEAAVKLLESAAKDPKNSPLKKTLEHDLRQTRFDAAINYFDQARTYIDSSKEAVNAARSNTIEKARKLFLALAIDESAEVSYLANAWAMKCAIEQTAPDDALKYYTNIMKKKDDPAATPAVRLVRYFHIQDSTLRRPDLETIGRNMLKPKVKGPAKAPVVTPTDQLHKVQKECDAWLKDYGIRKTYEGEGVLFELAEAFFTEAQIIENPPKVDKKPPPKFDEKRVAALYKQAEQRFVELAKLDGDIAERARQRISYIRRTTLHSVKDLVTFNDHVDWAMMKRNEDRELSNKLDDAKTGEQAKKIEEDRKKKLKEVIDSLTEGLRLATPADPPTKVDEARYYLCGAYLTYGDPYRAAIIGEAAGPASSADEAFLRGSRHRHCHLCVAARPASR